MAAKPVIDRDGKVIAFYTGGFERGQQYVEIARRSEAEVDIEDCVSPVTVMHTMVFRVGHLPVMDHTDRGAIPVLQPANPDATLADVLRCGNMVAFKLDKIVMAS